MPAPFVFDNSYARALPDCALAWRPQSVPQPRLVYLNQPLADALGLALDGQDTAALFAGNVLPAGSAPIAQIYAGHQFGHFSPQLGDGRAVLLGEHLDPQGGRHDIAFKGSGPTPFSRGGDGKAALGPMLREVLIGEALHALGIPTTRALAVVTTGETIYREQALPGAVLTRVAASHLRVGTFEYFAARGDIARLRQLADYAIARHDAGLPTTPAGYLAFLEAVAERQAALLARWMCIGFIHGVMNTDNMTISGESIDFGPCAFMEAYDPATVFSSIDRQGRYAYGNQPGIAHWNLARLASSLLPLIDDDDVRASEQAQRVIDRFPALYQRHWLAGMRAKLGLDSQTQTQNDRHGADHDPASDAEDGALIEDWLGLLQQDRVDFTLAWRQLAEAAAGQPAGLQALFTDQAALAAWYTRWQARCASDDDGRLPAERAAAMRRVNPWLIPRNHRVEEALAAATTAGDLTPFRRLLAALSHPCETAHAQADYTMPATADFNAGYRTFCGT
ncbi:MAG: YdiU family protein [Sterolibacterium sp.]|nr:YdiU family protein [Sterolibacterium sp.]